MCLLFHLFQVPFSMYDGVCIDVGFVKVWTLSEDFSRLLLADLTFCLPPEFAAR